MRKRIDIHGYRSQLLITEKKIGLARNPLSGRNVELIRQFERQLLSEGLSDARIVKYLRMLKRLGELLGKGFDEATKADIQELVCRIERGGYSPWTKKDFKVALKRGVASRQGLRHTAVRVRS